MSIEYRVKNLSDIGLIKMLRNITVCFIIGLVFGLPAYAAKKQNITPSVQASNSTVSVIALLEQDLRQTSETSQMTLQPQGSNTFYYVQKGLAFNEGDAIRSSGGVRLQLQCPAGDVLSFSGAFDVTLIKSKSTTCSINLRRGSVHVEAINNVEVQSATESIQFLGNSVGAVNAGSGRGAIRAWLLFDGVAALSSGGKINQLAEGDKLLTNISNGLQSSSVNLSDQALAADIFARLKAVSQSDSSTGQIAAYYTQIRDSYLSRFTGEAIGGAGQFTQGSMDEQLLGLEANADVEDLISSRGNTEKPDFQVRRDIWDYPDANNVTNNASVQVQPGTGPVLIPTGAIAQPF